MRFTLASILNRPEHSRIIPHRTGRLVKQPDGSDRWVGCNASDAPGQYAAETCPSPRQAVTAQFAYEHACDLYAVYTYDAEDAACGLDPWRIVEIDGDLRTGDLTLYWNNACSERTVKPDYEVYVSRRELVKLGLMTA